MNKKIRSIFGCTEGTLRETAANNAYDGDSKKMIFGSSNEGFLDNGRRLLEERVSFFDGKTNHIRCLSVNDLNTHFSDWIPYKHELWPDSGYYRFYQCVWETRPVLVKIAPTSTLFIDECCREIAIATEMGIHKNVLKLLACCLEAQRPVCIYEYVENGDLSDRIFEEKNQTKAPLDLKNRLSIAYKISHALAYLHTAFPRTIIYRGLTPENVMLDVNNTAKLIEFGMCVSIPKGKTSVETNRIVGSPGYMAPEYIRNGKVGEKTDVYSFGMLLLQLLTGDRSKVWISDYFCSYEDRVPLGTLLRKLIAENTRKLIGAYVTVSEAPNEEVLYKQFGESTELGVRCISEEEENRPTMTEVATELKNIITYSASTPQ